jgi:hypothetical protein
MKRKTIVTMIFVVFIFSCFITAQEENGQKMELPPLTIEYKLDRALINQVGDMILGIAYAKTKGDSPEDFASFGLNAWGSWWKDEDYSYYVRKWYRIFSTDVNFRMEILSETEDMIDLKMNIFGERYIDTYAESGVTREEYIRFIGALLSSMAEYMGFEYKKKIEDDWIYLTIAKK